MLSSSDDLLVLRIILYYMQMLSEYLCIEEYDLNGFERARSA